MVQLREPRISYNSYRMFSNKNCFSFVFEILIAGKTLEQTCQCLLLNEFGQTAQQVPKTNTMHSTSQSMKNTRNLK